MTISQMIQNDSKNITPPSKIYIPIWDGPTCTFFFFFFFFKSMAVESGQATTCPPSPLHPPTLPSGGFPNSHAGKAKSKLLVFRFFIPPARTEPDIQKRLMASRSSRTSASGPLSRTLRRHSFGPETGSEVCGNASNADKKFRPPIKPHFGPYLGLTPPKAQLLAISLFPSHKYF